MAKESYSSLLRNHADKENDPGLIPAPTLIEIAKHIDIQDERIEELENELEQHHWIPVSERLPEKIKGLFKSKECFVTDGKAAWVAAYNFSAYYWQCPLRNITHWKPISLSGKVLKGE